MESKIAVKNIERYENYKDSGVEWLGEIPEHWDCIRMKRLYEDISIKNRPDELLSSVTQDRGVIPRDWIESRMVMPSGNLESFKFIEKEDFAISLRSFEGGLEYCHHDGIISPAYTVLKKKRNDLNPLFYKYLFKSVSFISELQTSVVGIREGKNISYSELSYSFLPIPPLQEQTQIAQFLDDKTSKIDAAIGIKEQQINLLKERKQILIHKAVTRGLDDNVELKDSGVEWIGEIPVHWEVKRLKYILKKDGFVRGPFGSALITSSFVKKGYKVYEQKNAIYDNLKLGSSYVDSRKFCELKRFEVKNKDFLMSCSGTIGKITLVNEPYEKGIINQAMLILRIDNEIINNLFFLELFRSDFMLNRILDNSKGSAMKNLVSSFIFKNLSIVIPPLSEQKEIAAYIETASQKIETAIALKQQEIAKLKEYKSSLINGVVTGKVRVC